MSAAMDNLPATTVAAVKMLATTNFTLQKTVHALAHLGCSCTVRTADIALESHDAFCRYKMKVQDIGVEDLGL